MIARTLCDFFRLAARADRGCHFVDVFTREERRISFAEMYGKASALAAKLRSCPLRPRFIAVIWMDPSPECLIAFMAVVLAGGIPAPVHAASKTAEALAALEKVEAEVLAMSPRQAARIDGVRSGGAGEASLLQTVVRLIFPETGRLPEPLPGVAGGGKERSY